MSTTKPELNPTKADLARELAAAVAVVTNPPPATYQGVQRGMTKDTAWRTNVAWWEAYSLAAGTKIVAGDEAAAAAWLRIEAEVVRRMFAANLGTPSKSWNPSQPTWPLATMPKAWPPGSKFAARRPWLLKHPQTRYHTGTDLGAQAGAPVLAPEAGTVIAPESGWEFNAKTGKGVKALIMLTDSGRTVLLGGIRPGSATVKAGQHVSAGQQLAEVGRYPGGDSMLHFQIYSRPLTEKEVNARKSWALNQSAPPDLVNPEGYLQGAAANPRYATVAAFGEGDGDGLVVNDIEGGEVNEGVMPAMPVAGDVVAAGGRTGTKPCLVGDCTLDDALAWQAALTGYYGQALLALKEAKARAAKGKAWTAAAAAGEKTLEVVSQFIAAPNPAPVPEWVEGCRACVDAYQALSAFAKPTAAKSSGGLFAALIGAVVVTTVVLVAVRK